MAVRNIGSRWSMNSSRRDRWLGDLTQEPKDYAGCEQTEKQEKRVEFETRQRVFIPRSAIKEIKPIATAI